MKYVLTAAVGAVAALGVLYYTGGLSPEMEERGRVVEERLSDAAETVGDAARGAADKLSDAAETVGEPAANETVTTTQ